MVSLKSSSARRNGAPPAYLKPRPPQLSRMDPDEIRRIVALGEERGLIQRNGKPSKIDRNGADISTLGPLRSQWIMMTPELAKRWLTNNFRNRSIREDVVNAYARDMLSGRWVYTHQGIAFNDRDELIDGQHRLHAVIVANVEVRMMVTFGLPPKIEGHEMTTMDAVDRGATRSVADQLKIQHGLKHGSLIAMICNSIAPICSTERTRRSSVGQTLEIYRAFEHPIHFVMAHRSHETGLRQAGVNAGFAFAIATELNGSAPINSTPIMLMFEAIVSGNGINWSGGIARLREFLTSPEAKLLTRGNDRALAELVLQAIHLQQQRKKVAGLQLVTDGADHFRALQSERVAKVAALFKLPGQEARKKSA
jgi:hypothetical protein